MTNNREARDEKTFRKHATEGQYVVRPAKGWDMIYVISGPHDSYNDAVDAIPDDIADEAYVKHVPSGSR